MGAFSSPWTWHLTLSAGCRDIIGPVPPSLLIRFYFYYTQFFPAVNSFRAIRYFFDFMPKTQEILPPFMPKRKENRQRRRRQV